VDRPNSFTQWSTEEDSSLITGVKASFSKCKEGVTVHTRLVQPDSQIRAETDSFCQLKVAAASGSHGYRIDMSEIMGYLRYDKPMISSSC